MSHSTPSAARSVSNQLKMGKFWNSSHGQSLTEKAHPDIIAAMTNFEDLDAILNLCECSINELMPSKEDYDFKSKSNFSQYYDELYFGWTKIVPPAIRAFYAEEE